MICFDLGNVIIECDVDKFYDQMKDFFSEEKYKHLLAMRDIIQTQHDLGIVTYRNFFEHFDMSLSKENVNQILDLWNQAVKPNDEMVEFVSSFEEKFGSVAFLSNIGYEHHKYLNNICPKLFKNARTHFSFEVGARKPSKLYFQSFIKELEYYRDEKFNEHFALLLIDDREDNCEMATRLGFRSFQFSLKDDLNNKEKIKQMKSIMERYQ